MVNYGFTIHHIYIYKIRIKLKLAHHLYHYKSLFYWSDNKPKTKQFRHMSKTAWKAMPWLSCNLSARMLGVTRLMRSSSYSLLGREVGSRSESTLQTRYYPPSTDGLPTPQLPVMSVTSSPHHMRDWHDVIITTLSHARLTLSVLKCLLFLRSFQYMKMPYQEVVILNIRLSPTNPCYNSTVDHSKSAPNTCNCAIN